MRVNMIYGATATFELASFARDPSSRQRFSLTAPAALILVLTASAAAWVANVRFVAPHLARATAPALVSANPYGDLVNPGFAANEAPPKTQMRVASGPPAAPVLRPNFPTHAANRMALASARNPYGEILPPRSLPVSPQASIAGEVLHDMKRAVSGLPAPARLAESAPPPPQAPPAFEPPLPPPRPAEFAALPASEPMVHPLARQRARAGAPLDHRTFFQKLFGLADSPAPANAVAYAAPEASVAAAAPRAAIASAPFAAPPASAVSSRYDRWTAVYDVAAHTVYLPDGTRLEAHSGLGDRLDDTSRFSERMRGPTPPHLYELQPREQLFHGVAALRLNPVGAGELFGRAGLLAHSYMLGPNGDSNGCVSFRDYDAFLQAYRSGQIKKLAVVARLD